MQMTLAIAFGAIGLMLIAWPLYSRKMTPRLRIILKAAIIGAIFLTVLWTFFSYQIPWLTFALFGAIMGAIVGSIIALAKYKLAS